VYVANEDGTLTQINPKTLAISNASGMGNRSVAVGESAIWTVGDRGLVHENRQGSVVRRVSQAGFSPFAVVAGGGAVWVLDYKLQSLWRIDPRTDDLRGRIRLGFTPGGLAFGQGRVWVTDNSGDAVVAIDPVVGQVMRRIKVGAGPIGVAVSDNSVWTANYRAGTLSRVDPRTGTVVTVPVGRNPTSIAVGGGAVWVPVRAS
jgi:YVTN family beta-propeller protein